MTAKAHTCKECGGPIEGRRRGKEFCSTPCRHGFNNRRMQRGAELYDLFRALRRERETAQAMKLWSRMCQLELSWNIEDEKARPGRRSYIPPKKAITLLLDKGSLSRGELVTAARAR